MKVKSNCEYNSTKENLNYIKNELSDSFFHVFKYSNIKVLKCYNQLFTYKGFFKNYGNWMMIFLVFSFIIIIIFFFATGMTPLLANINEEIAKLKNRKKIHKKRYETDNNLLKKDMKIKKIIGQKNLKTETKIKNIIIL